MRRAASYFRGPFFFLVAFFVAGGFPRANATPTASSHRDIIFRRSGGRPVTRCPASACTTNFRLAIVVCSGMACSPASVTIRGGSRAVDVARPGLEARADAVCSCGARPVTGRGLGIHSRGAQHPSAPPQLIHQQNRDDFSEASRPALLHQWEVTGLCRRQHNPPHWSSASRAIALGASPSIEARHMSARSRNNLFLGDLLPCCT